VGVFEENNALASSPNKMSQYCDMSTSCWVAQRSVARQPSAKQLATKHKRRGGAERRGLLRAAAMTSHVFTWLPGDEPPSC
jgi:hypothetical protein